MAYVLDSCGLSVKDVNINVSVADPARPADRHARGSTQTTQVTSKAASQQTHCWRVRIYYGR